MQHSHVGQPHPLQIQTITDPSTQSQNTHSCSATAQLISGSVKQNMATITEVVCLVSSSHQRVIQESAEPSESSAIVRTLTAETHEPLYIRTIQIPF